MKYKQDHFALENFEGPLEFLLSLIQRDEINIYDVPIQELTQQFLLKLTEWQAHYLEKGAEFVGSAAYLVWLKSKMLLPQEENPLMGEGVQEEDPHFEIIHHLLDYCRFKQAAKELTIRQEQQQAFYFRGISAPERKKPLGLNEVSLDELASLFQEMMKRAAQSKGQIQEENWRVSDKIRSIRHQLLEQSAFAFELLFSPDKSRIELVVIFLAVLELMKLGVAGVGIDPTTSQLLIFTKKEG